ncbi:hypothetical protein F2Q69_00005546 [Brassica cretica]|uniref:Uncharacterized protein n=1 Tax=Brassica cretica TaxID=69181 RepID=A0A8S9NT34_BRACR|nr:hypothetical protein F2Q69_00005546 [Brassica cretica]
MRASRRLERDTCGDLDRQCATRRSASTRPTPPHQAAVPNHRNPRFAGAHNPFKPPPKPTIFFTFLKPYTGTPHVMAGQSSGKADAVGTEDETQTDTFSLRTTVSGDDTHAHAPAVCRRSTFSLFSPFSLDLFCDYDYDVSM